jgi:hypothetical protein
MTSTFRPVRRRSKVAVAALAVSGVLVGLSASSALASTQIGQTFTPDGLDGSDTTTFLQSVTPAGEYTAPSSGVITSWSFRNGGSAIAIKLKVARSAGGDAFTIIGSSPLKNAPLNKLTTYTDVRIPVHAGDILGLYNATSGGFLTREVAGYGYHVLVPGADPPLSDTRTYISSPTADIQLDVSAKLEADCDGDGLGDETQDPDASSCNPPAPPPPSATTASTPTGQRAAAKKRCKKKFEKGPKRAKCLKKAKKLPV